MTLKLSCFHVLTFKGLFKWPHSWWKFPSWNNKVWALHDTERKQHQVFFVSCFNPPGYFTAPVSGKYFFSGILTGHKNIKIEAVLSKSNTGVARVDSAGYQPEGLEKPMAEAKQIPGALAVFNIILSMEKGDTVCIDLVTGKLAYSSEPLTIFSGMLLYETIWSNEQQSRQTRVSVGETVSVRASDLSAGL